MKKSTKRRLCPGCGILITDEQYASLACLDRDPKSPPEPIRTLDGEHLGDLCLFCDRNIPAEDGAAIRELIAQRRTLFDDSTFALPSGRIAPASEINHLIWQWGADERERMVAEETDRWRRRRGHTQDRRSRRDRHDRA